MKKFKFLISSYCASRTSLFCQFKIFFCTGRPYWSCYSIVLLAIMVTWAGWEWGKRPYPLFEPSHSLRSKPSLICSPLQLSSQTANGSRQDTMKEVQRNKWTRSFFCVYFHFRLSQSSPRIIILVCSECSNGNDWPQLAQRYRKRPG